MIGRPRISAFGLLAVLTGGLPDALPAQPRAVTARDSAFNRFLGLAGMVRGGVIEPHWMAGGSSFWFVEGTPANTIAYRVDARTGNKTPLVDVSRLRQALKGALGHEPPYAGLPFDRFTLVDGERAIRFALEGRDFTVDLAGYVVTAWPAVPPMERERVTPRLVRRGFPTTGPDIYEMPSPDGRWFATVRENDLWLRSTADGREQELTTDGTPEEPWDVVGAAWSPSGLGIAAIRTDLRGVNRLPLVHWLKPVEEVVWRAFTKAGGPLPQYDVRVLDIRSLRQVEVDLGPERDQYVAIAGWLPDGSEVLVLAMSRSFKRLRLLATNPTTGKTRLVLQETQPTFIKGIAGNPGWRDLLTVLDDGKRFLWISERDGWDHLYLYGMDGTLIRRLTTGTFPVLGVTAVDTKSGWVYFTAHAERRPYDTHLYRVGLDGQEFRRLTEVPGQHSASFSPSKEFFLDSHSSMERPPAVDLRAADGRLIATLATAKVDALEALGWTPPEEVVVKAADGVTELHGILFKPARFDPNERYPVVEYIYAGPQTTVSPRTFVSTSLQQAVAQLGFVVFSVDARGTPERGKAFQDVVYGHFGRHEIPDHKAALQQAAATRAYMDLRRVGIFGGSWGGYMTLRAMVLAPELYKVGVSIYPVVEMYDQMAQAIEPYMGVPADRPGSFEEGSSLRLLDKLAGKIMFIHGTTDVNATFSATMKAVDALTRAGKPYDLVVLNEQNHAPTGAARDYWLQRLRDYFVQHLEP